jgi:DNA-binding GntR family transcriptional regulator
MSKAPVRAAMSELRLQGLVHVIPQSGTYVFSPTPQEIEALCDFRFLLEGQALQTAMVHNAPALVAGLARVVTLMREADWTTGEADRPLDRAYHQLFITCCDNQYLAEAYETIAHRVEALRYRFMHTTVFRHRAFAEHAEMAELLAAGRTSRAVAVLDGHIARTREFQSNAPWSPGRSRRRDYKFRAHADVFRNPQ